MPGPAPLRLAANLTYLFTELPMSARFEAAAEAGFQGVEIPFPYDLSARDLARAARAAGVEFVAMATPPPNWTGGPRGFAARPGGEARFRSDFERALRYAEVLGARRLHILGGLAAGPDSRVVMLENLAWAAARAPHIGLMLEPVSPEALPGVFLDDLDLALALIAEVGAPNLGLQFDCWHIAALTGDLPGAWDRAAPKVRHVQVSGWPDRAEPDAGIDLPALQARMQGAGYAGWLAAEYAPRRGTVAGLGWMAALRGAAVLRSGTRPENVP